MGGKGGEGGKEKWEVGRGWERGEGRKGGREKGGREGGGRGKKGVGEGSTQ